MTARSERTNRGPSAARGNRDALLAAARRLFAEHGYHVPLSAIAKEAGVGQGVLYRHFPSRFDLALSVFEENLDQLRTLAADHGDDAFCRFWEQMIDLVVESAAFIEMAVDARRTHPDYDGETQFRTILAPLLERAQDGGHLPAHLTLDDLVLAQRAAYGAVVTAESPQRARAAAWRITQLLGLTRSPR